MSTLSREHRRLLEDAVAEARTVAEGGARKVLRDQYAVQHHEPWPHMKDAEGDSTEVLRAKASARDLRNQLRAHGRQLGDQRDSRRETQAIEHLVQACAFEHWHRMLFARFLAENDLLLDAGSGVAMTLNDVRELAREQGRDWMDVAAELAQRMLLAVFRPDDPVLKVQLPPETRLRLEEKLAVLPKEIFYADDSLGWVYQFWQRDEKDRVNRSEVKIGADQIAAVTQLFTEDYMVLFLLENTLGAWWTTKRRAEGNDPALLGYKWKYLRLCEDGSPTAGSFDGWPRVARDLRVLDPCMGSGHFLVFALPILARMRMEEEGLSLKEALAAVLKENLFGLEIDARCSQIAAFNLALAAWRVAGQHFNLPEMNLACSGLCVNAPEADWLRLAGEDHRAKETMSTLYGLFSNAGILGSLIDPTQLRASLFVADYKDIRTLFEAAIASEESTDELRELAIAASGIVAASRLLTKKFTLICTNVPYLGRAGHCETLANFAEAYAPDAAADLATIMIHRCKNFLHAGGALALVHPQNWWVGRDYSHFRKRLLRDVTFRFAVVLGEEAWWTFGNRGPNTILFIAELQPAARTSTFAGLDLSTKPGSAVVSLETKAAILRQERVPLLSSPPQIVHVNQLALAESKNARISIAGRREGAYLSSFVDSGEGSSTGDADRFLRCFWEVGSGGDWLSYSGPGYADWNYCDSSLVMYWQNGLGELAQSPQARIQNTEMWTRKGVLVGRVRGITATLFNVGCFSKGAVLVCPKVESDLPALYAFLKSPEYEQYVRTIDPRVSAATSVITDVPFEASEWRERAGKLFPTGLPAAPSSDPTQATCDGGIASSLSPLQVAVARLVGHRWPRQTGASFPDCPALGSDSLEKHAASNGIVPLSAIDGESSAADRLRALLVDAYGSDWSAVKLQQLLGEWGSLEDWLRDGFFEEHCRIFHQRPFVWHVWDGREDGFHALVHYHKLAPPNGEGRQLLRKLIYTYLGRWIERQNEDVKAGKEGADGRLTAATHLKTELEKILEGEKPYDIFVRWKPLKEQPIGWEPDINDGVRLNVRPWLTAKPYLAASQDACILRVTPHIPYGKDRGKSHIEQKTISRGSGAGMQSKRTQTKTSSVTRTLTAPAGTTCTTRLTRRNNHGSSGKPWRQRDEAARPLDRVLADSDACARRRCCAGSDLVDRCRWTVAATAGTFAGGFSADLYAWPL